MRIPSRSASLTFADAELIYGVADSESDSNSTSLGVVSKKS
jgi:hypothetical protein